MACRWAVSSQHVGVGEQDKPSSSCRVRDAGRRSASSPSCDGGGVGAAVKMDETVETVEALIEMRSVERLLMVRLLKSSHMFL